MSVEMREQLLTEIVALLRRADDAGEAEIAIHLDRARIAAGGSGDLKIGRSDDDSAAA